MEDLLSELSDPEKEITKKAFETKNENLLTFILENKDKWISLNHSQMRSYSRAFTEPLFNYYDQQYLKNAIKETGGSLSKTMFK